MDMTSEQFGWLRWFGRVKCKDDADWQGLFQGKFWTAQVDTFMASAEREPIMGLWGQAEPLVRGSEGEALLKLTAF